MAAGHSTSPSWTATDWTQIVELYDLLESVVANPVVALNRAVALTEFDGPEHRLAALEAIVGLERSLWHTALADDLQRLGREGEVAEEFQTAVALAPPMGNGASVNPVSMP